MRVCIRIAVLFIFCFCSPGLYAQKAGALAEMDKIFSQAARAPKPPASASPAVRLPFLRPTSYNKQLSRVERAVQRPILIKKGMRPMLVNYQQLEPTYKKYDRVMQNFVAFKKQADPFLYYQVKDKRILEPEEKRQWLERIYDMRQQLASLRMLISVKEPSVQAAYRYLNEVLRVISADVALLSEPQPTHRRQDRLYQEDEFFLHDPQHNLFIRALHRLGIFVGKVKLLPPDLKIAVFNDSYLSINELKRAQQKGKLFNSRRVLFTRDAYNLLNQIDKGIYIPDVIITDICSPDVGGVVLTQELRNAGYNGVILALTGYKEKEIDGQLFMDYGFDGAISNPTFEMSPSVCRRVVEATQNYFYYRNLHGWMR